jgi:hypothetical protein
MDNNEKHENNYVAPTSVDLNKANLNEASDILNRERTNIVSATLQANNAIDEKSVGTVNNAIKVRKKNPIINALIVIICLLIGGFLIYVVLKYSKMYISSDNTTTTTTTSLTMTSKVSTYLNDLSKVRKFETSTNIIFLLPENYDLVNNNLYYLYIEKNSTEITFSKYGTYTLENDELTLVDLDAKFVITEGGISSDNLILNVFDDEYKYYYNKTNENTNLLLINGNPNSSIALYLTSNGISTNIITSSYEETSDSINLTDVGIFTKENNNLLIDNTYLTLK